MNKEQVIELISNKTRLIRVEKGYSQEKMAEIIGISKKTLVQIEKGRTLAGWTNTVAVCALFRDSEVLQSVLGDEPLEVIETIAHNNVDRPKSKSMGGKVWWKEIAKKGEFRLQQNMISQHYRILDDDHVRWFSTFDLEEATSRLNELTSRGGNYK
ncbi:helix-turn-helix domain-containing protein [Heyndrickxia sporothermodurans]|uniref:helix-turn-helix transcriptional regulator n=1 Tax=Heyndrickxia sporothermodurans TaxID=46224 RepID=UPI002DBE96BC|nr:helix-turn-helix domain-containing protein [Heyndrickxia sporothermodurans]MEB6549238.1 helix-turn-helix domain-containing protein [Heyndrickxia sporothermodurans]MED3649745.1 helix-turn-helix domain-containing protein [Heyndrickxia sporothermodurans]MED3653124.1 helix-turn-helix domain-containing protein [Heyndrickxia sporothermodurans]MED3697731.1 helix-turn-helix domain-containing protein [Heyndrickxia sporothermodurans]MED3779994.1 helix-turn-helix domain-containing protein [Heyndrickxi